MSLGFLMVKLSLSMHAVQILAQVFWLRLEMWQKLKTKIYY